MRALDVPLIGGPKPLTQIKLAGGLRSVADAIERVVVDSYKRHAVNHRTDAEDNRRAEVCVKWFKVLVNDHRWTADRALSELRHILRLTLDGVDYEVPNNLLWCPDLSLVAG